MSETPTDNTTTVDTPDAAAAARRLDGEPAPLTREQRWARTKLALGATVLAALGIAAAPGIAERLTPASFSEELTTFTFTSEANDLYSAAQSIPGNEHVSTDDAVSHIENLPENAEALSDGIQLGETISIPVEITK